MLGNPDLPPPPRPVAFVVVREESQESYVKSPVARQALALLERIRAAGMPVIYHPSGNASKQLQKALGVTPKPFAAVFLGPDECAAQRVQIKVLDTQTQSPCAWGDLEGVLSSLAATSAPGEWPKAATSEDQKKK